MSIYKVERNSINESIDDKMEFLCYLEVGFRKDGSIEFRTEEDILFPVSEAGGGAPSWTIKYVKGYKQRINIVQVDD